MKKYTFLRGFISVFKGFIETFKEISLYELGQIIAIIVIVISLFGGMVIVASLFPIG